MENSVLLTEANFASNFMSDDQCESNSNVDGQKRCKELRQSMSESTKEARRIKRFRNEDIIQSDVDSSEDFILVQRKAKRIARSNSYNDRRAYTYFEENKYEVCLTSLEVLPKQIGLVKLLKSENLLNITRIKYRSPYKVFIKFETREEADKMLNNEKFCGLGYRMYLTNEVSYTYGTVKYLEIEVEEKELLESFKSQSEIISVRRLKKQSSAGGWIDSETVRFCFKGNMLPEYVYGYGGRFKVEPYIFPVTQCSNCWKYGHLAKNCPKNNKVCPKCGGRHENCEITIFKCVNCKGNHISFYKKCPIFFKEKRIRTIMSKENCTYKKALLLYADRNFVSNMPAVNDSYSQELTSSQESISGEINIQHEREKENLCISNENELCDDQEERVSRLNRNNLKLKRKKKKVKNKKTKREPNKINNIQENRTQATPREHEETDENSNEIRNNNNFLNSIIKLKDIALSNKSVEEKIITSVKYIFEWIKSFFQKTFINGEFINKIFNALYNG